MNPKIPISARIKLAAHILKSWVTDEQIKYPGVRFDNREDGWHEGYGVPMDDDIPDFVKKDNDGWDYVTRSNDQ